MSNKLSLNTSGSPIDLISFIFLKTSNEELNKLTSEVKGLKTTYKKSNISLYELIKRPDFSYQDLNQYIDAYELDDF